MKTAKQQFAVLVSVDLPNTFTLGHVHLQEENTISGGSFGSLGFGCQCFFGISKASLGILFPKLRSAA